MPNRAGDSAIQEGIRIR